MHLSKPKNEGHTSILIQPHCLSCLLLGQPLRPAPHGWLPECGITAALLKKTHAHIFFSLLLFAASMDLVVSFQLGSSEAFGFVARTQLGVNTSPLRTD